MAQKASLKAAAAAAAAAVSGADVHEHPMFYTSDINHLNLKLQVLYLQGKLPEAPWSQQEMLDNPILRFAGPCTDTPSELYVTCQLFSRGRAISLPVNTHFHTVEDGCRFLEWLDLPTRYSELPRDTQIALTLWDIHAPRVSTPVGGTTFPLFDEYGVMKRGRVKLFVWPNVEADGAVATTTPHLHGAANEMDRLEERIAWYDRGEIAHLPWLDPHTFREIERVNRREAAAARNLYLYVELPHFDYPVVCQPQEPFESSSTSNIFVEDPDAWRDNPVETKHRRLARAQRHVLLGQKVKPSTADRRRLEGIIASPPMQALSPEDSDLLWKFRYALVRDRRALPKFLKCVDWADPDETLSATRLMEGWAAIETDDALELLGSDFRNNSIVRDYAVAKLEAASDETLQLFLLQLVQALRYEARPQSCRLTRLLIGRGVESFTLGSFLHWYLAVECEDKADGPLFAAVLDLFLDNLRAKYAGSGDVRPGHSVSLSTGMGGSGGSGGGAGGAARTRTSRGASFAASLTASFASATGGSGSAGTATATTTTAADGDGDDGGGDSSSVADLRADASLSTNSTAVAVVTSNEGDGSDGNFVDMLKSQRDLIAQLNGLVRTLNNSYGKDRPKKIAKMQAMLGPGGELSELTSFPPMRLPLDPSVVVTGIDGSRSSIFKSALSPLRLAFESPTHPGYMIIFKQGDDLRQDQLIIQLITLMDGLLRKENLDLCLTPYAVLATSVDSGLAQLISAYNISQVLAENRGDIRQFFKEHNPDETSESGIAPAVLDTFVRSCAGYCVITYILGIGDRHLDNLMVTTDGHLFHIDFGYILGRDPKPFPPPMKLCKEMVDAMGGLDSVLYKQFVSHCCESFNILRKSANLILNLFSLMVDAHIPDLAVEPEASLAKVYENFRLDLDDEDALEYFQLLIDTSVKALFPQVIETFHRWAQYWRK